MTEHHFIDLMQATHKELWELYRMPQLVPCPICLTSGFVLVQSEGTLNVFGVDMEGTFLSGAPCPNCLPTYPGYTYGFCPS